MYNTIDVSFESVTTSLMKIKLVAHGEYGNHQCAVYVDTNAQMRDKVKQTIDHLLVGIHYPIIFLDLKALLEAIVHRITEGLKCSVVYIERWE